MSEEKKNFFNQPIGASTVLLAFIVIGWNMWSEIKGDTGGSFFKTQEPKQEQTLAQKQYEKVKKYSAECKEKARSSLKDPKTYYSEANFSNKNIVDARFVAHAIFTSKNEAGEETPFTINCMAVTGEALAYRITNYKNEIIFDSISKNQSLVDQEKTIKRRFEKDKKICLEQLSSVKYIEDYPIKGDIYLDDIAHNIYYLSNVDNRNYVVKIGCFAPNGNAQYSSNPRIFKLPSE